MRYTLALVIIVAAATALFADGLASKSAQPNMQKVGSLATTLTEEQISELYTVFTNEKTGKTYQLIADFEPKIFRSSEKTLINKYKKSGEAPYRLTVALYEIKKQGNSNLSKRINGTAEFYIQDSEGKIVLKRKSSSLSTMCPG